MGLIKALAGAVGGTFADQWLEFFVCESLDANTLAAKGEKKSSKRSSNTKGEDNVISNGSGVVVNAEAGGVRLRVMPAMTYAITGDIQGGKFAAFLFL